MFHAFSQPRSGCSFTIADGFVRLFRREHLFPDPIERGCKKWLCFSSWKNNQKTAWNTIMVYSNCWCVYTMFSNRPIPKRASPRLQHHVIMHTDIRFQVHSFRCNRIIYIYMYTLMYIIYIYTYIYIYIYAYITGCVSWNKPIFGFFGIHHPLWG